MIQYIKSQVLLSRSLFSILNEIVFFKEYNNKHNPFLVNLLYAFQDKNAFYLIEEYYPGGDLRYHINRKFLTETKSKFLISNLIIGLEFLHNNGFVHRNLKPDNLLLDSNGYLHISDFKLLRKAESITYFDTSGNKGYMAPEIAFRQNHGMVSDIFSIGIILYEMMFNKLPFKHSTKKEYCDSLINTKDFLIKESHLPEGWSRDCADFINRCIQKKAAYRIGYNGIEELKEHRWLKEFKWDSVKKRILKAPFIPKKGKNIKIRERIDELYLNNELSFNQYKMDDYKDYCEITKMFEGYYYNYKIEKKNQIKELNKTKSILLMSIKTGIKKLETIKENNNIIPEDINNDNNNEENNNNIVLDEDEGKDNEDKKNLLDNKDKDNKKELDLFNLIKNHYNKNNNQKKKSKK